MRATPVAGVGAPSNAFDDDAVAAAAASDREDAAEEEEAETEAGREMPLKDAGVDDEEKASEE